MACTVIGIAILSVFLTSVPMCVHANVFLGRSGEQAPSEQLSLGVQHALLGELEGLLGGEHKSFTGRRLAKIENALQPVFIALPKNEHGKLGHAAASYALHRLFVQRHGWSVKGLQSESKSVAAWNASSPTALFQTGKVSDGVTGAFEERVAETGLGLHELAVLAATLEHLVHNEAMARLRLAYGAQGVTAEDVVGMTEAEEIMDSYMVVYILGFMLKNASAATPADVKNLRRVVGDVYPTWNATQEFMREVKESVAPKRDYLYFSDVATVIEEAGERYGTWQDKECRQMKDELVAVEDAGAGGAGRVRLSDFYGLALNEGKSQFSESIPFLRQQGALDESDPSNPRVLITNYIASPSNCVASSSYFSVCCIDECENLFQQLERSIAAPDALPDEILTRVSSLASHTMPKNRELSSWLRERLHEIAKHHHGRVPLHGRLFTQWMHFAYPRECSYPHLSGAVQTQRPEEVFSFESLESLETTATEEQMKEHIQTFSNKANNEAKSAFSDEGAMWSMEEELVVHKPSLPVAQTQDTSTVSLILRGVACIAMVVAMVGLMRNSDPLKGKDAGVFDEHYV